VKLKRLLQSAKIAQGEFAKAIGRSDSFVSQLLAGGAGASKETIDATLAFLTARLGRPVTYEETFGAAETAAQPEPIQEPVKG